MSVEKIIAIISGFVLTIALFPAMIIGSYSIGSFFVDKFVDMWASYMNLWKMAILVIRQCLKGGEDGGRCEVDQNNN